MPIYEFECPACHGKKEELFSTLQKAVEFLTRCARCGTLMIKQPSVFAYKWANGQAPARQDERDYDWMVFNEPNPLNPEGMSDHEMVKRGLAKTKDMKY